jgi:single-stranded-DNA-specific exonuclease
MPMNRSTWVLAPTRPEADVISKELGIPPAIAQILVNRRIVDAGAAQRFLYGTLAELHDPFLMVGMKEAVARIRRALSRNEKIVIFGDYDVDGILSVVMLQKALETLGGNVEYFIPERLKDGYGIKTEHVQVIVEKQAGLIISVDCGVKAVHFVNEAKARGIDVIITDHHRPGAELPEAEAILNPQVDQCRYPEKNLAGVGVVFKLIQALYGEVGKSSLLPHYVKLVAIGTIADVVELKGENRLLVKHGLKTLENTSNLGLKTLLDACGLGKKRISEGDVGFRIGPRINAAGRMGTTDLAVRLFFSRSVEECWTIVRRLEELNSKRQAIEKKIFSQAARTVKEKALDDRYRFLVMGCEEWHRGVIGIVASRLKDAFHRPVLLFAYEDGKAFGSGRSITEFSMIECLDSCNHLFLNYGGHTYAVGCSLERGQMAAFKSSVNDFAGIRITDADLKRKVSIDVRMDFSDLQSSLIEYFSLLLPFGVGNPKPLFLTERVEVANSPQKLQNKHIKFLAKQNGRTFEALGWEKGEWADSLRKGDEIDIAYSFQFSEYRGEERLYLSLEDIRK